MPHLDINSYTFSRDHAGIQSQIQCNIRISEAACMSYICVHIDICVFILTYADNGGCFIV